MGEEYMERKTSDNRSGKIASVIGIVLNLLLAGGKIALGAVFSLSLIHISEPTRLID